VQLDGASPGLYVKHFKTSQRGVFLHGGSKTLFQDSSLPDRYREQVLQAMATGYCPTIIEIVTKKESYF
jgi:hypothetical protein